MRERFLFLHIGHDKTGSTALQAAFSASREVLRNHHIDYPLTGDDARAIQLDRMVPVGNARYLSKSPQAFAKEIALLPKSDGHVMFSSELLFNMLAREDDLSFVEDAARTCGFSAVRVLLFIRDPFSHAVSAWQQRVKGWQGETASLDDWLAESYRTPERVHHVVSRFRSSGAVQLTIRNYDRNRDRLVEEVEAWLTLQKATLVRPRGTINRSLTGSEVALQRALNQHIGPSGKVFAFRLVNRLPDLPYDPPRPSIAAQNAALERLFPALDAVNALLPSEDRYRMDLIAASSNEERTYCFNEAQLAIVAEGIADVVREMSERERSSAFGRAIARARSYLRNGRPRS